jgi:alpha-D-ribose 1-methylphosphonate 5-triphosphate diphosphatase
VILGHDETSPDERARFRALGAVTSEFPMTLETARSARAAGEDVVLGAPNVMRGGSHNNALDAARAVAEGLCTVLATDYYYPAPLIAAFKLAADGVTDLASAWALVAENPARAAGLPDRGVIAPGRRADLILVDASGPLPRVVAVFVAGRRAYTA